MKWIERMELEAGRFQSQSRQKKMHIMIIYLTDSDEEAIVDFVEDQEELYNKTNEHFREMPRRIACASSYNL